MRREQISVLVVEDEPIIRLGAVMDLEDAGFIVFEAGNPDEAMMVLADHPEIQALFTDVEMPGSMNGLTLAAAVRDRWPPIKIVVTSGRVRKQDTNLPEDALFVPKPYESRQIAATIRNMVAG
jgi:CheY-like chemotaxis protein